MTSQEFQSLQKDAGMKNQDVERMFGVSDQTVINWRKGNTRIPLAVQTLIRMKAEQSRAKV
jgi:DNA-binding transcriptional regulator YiaG